MYYKWADPFQKTRQIRRCYPLHKTRSKSLKCPKDLAHVDFSNLALSALHMLSQGPLSFPSSFLPQDLHKTLPSTSKALPFHHFHCSHLANLKPSWPEIKSQFLRRPLTQQTRVVGLPIMCCYHIWDYSLCSTLHNCDSMFVHSGQGLSPSKAGTVLQTGFVCCNVFNM